MNQEVPEKLKELVMCVPSQPVISNIQNIKGYQTSFQPRYLIENDESVRQVIPYVILTDKDNQITRYLVYQRSKEGDRELAHSHSIGVGGHISLKDIDIEDYETSSINRVIRNNIIRELFEEFFHPFPSSLLPQNVVAQAELLIQGDCGIDKFHLGVVIIIPGSTHIRPKSNEIVSCEYMTLQEAMEIKNMESWSKLVLAHLKRKEDML